MRQKYFDLIKKGKLDEIKRLKTENKIYGSEIDASGYNALHEAVIYDQIEIMEWLVSNNILEIDEGDEGGYTPLHIAARAHNIETIRWLINHGADPEHVNYMSQSPIDILREYRPTIYRQLLEEHLLPLETNMGNLANSTINQNSEIPNLNLMGLSYDHGLFLSGSEHGYNYK